ncbi:glucosaminidase domain-containing protein [Paenibacillus tyrfis]|uniref:glucosaminidase domain-containing protein n=1 Tax=Paenibacillus tyrfis TaxID=1501230 RepID=UPI0020A1E728|nr:glucosaminidase domain-containing protein [Paenibacillus tyrfis]MCP1306469.1 glucosaminidase domain-containing protein [Paenibacillus tyrfis]
MFDTNHWWEKAKEASRQTGWFATVIFAQWQWETGYFQSRNFTENRNIAGQTWTPQYPESMKGTARPASEGGYYVRYDDPVVGYVDFIQRNPRYAGVRLQRTEEGQIREIARQGWAADPNYAESLISRLRSNAKQGYTLEEVNEPVLKAEIANNIIDGYLKPAYATHEASYQAALAAGDTEGAETAVKLRDWQRTLANALRRASGLPEQ